MRLDPATIAPVLQAVRESFGDTAQVWLFGSRTDDAKRGGDIDLYIETDLDRDIVTRRSDLLRRLEAIYGEQKIDLAIRPRSRAPHPLHEIARERGIRLSDAAR
ncbi:nucleotidyltransferase domain-containing protein [uncultured Thiohalocapsa sp.]|uniref:nucleotidyltransferase domain-containing protein n=1 Tax=uncultured Thiohalocapsa sp. TaxID=768990 RepID=UPI0025E7C12A|nr:nucleotidyltransferase domain-containing protein [uncultured Thiohalocapsa sp.]